MLAMWLGTNNTIRGKVVASLKSGLWWILWVHVCSWFICAPMCSNYARTSLLFGLCKSMWIIDSLVIHLSPHPRAPTRPSTPEMLQNKECTPIPYLSQPHFEGSVRSPLTLPKMGVWSPPGLPKIQKTIAGAKHFALMCSLYY